MIPWWNYRTILKPQVSDSRCLDFLSTEESISCIMGIETGLTTVQQLTVQAIVDARIDDGCAEENGPFYDHGTVISVED